MGDLELLLDLTNERDELEGRELPSAKRREKAMTDAEKEFRVWLSLYYIELLRTVVSMKHTTNTYISLPAGSLDNPQVRLECLEFFRGGAEDARAMLTMAIDDAKREIAGLIR